MSHLSVLCIHSSDIQQQPSRRVDIFLLYGGDDENNAVCEPELNLNLVFLWGSCLFGAKVRVSLSRHHMGSLICGSCSSPRLVLLLQSASGLEGIGTDFHDDPSRPALISTPTSAFRLVASLSDTQPVVGGQGWKDIGALFNSIFMVVCFIC